MILPYDVRKYSDDFIITEYRFPNCLGAIVTRCTEDPFDEWSIEPTRIGHPPDNWFIFGHNKYKVDLTSEEQLQQILYEISTRRGDIYPEMYHVITKEEVLQALKANKKYSNLTLDDIELRDDAIYVEYRRLI